MFAICFLMFPFRVRGTTPVLEILSKLLLIGDAKTVIDFGLEMKIDHKRTVRVVRSRFFLAGLSRRE